jgi:hypothetical protein
VLPSSLYLESNSTIPSTPHPCYLNATNFLWLVPTSKNCGEKKEKERRKEYSYTTFDHRGPFFQFLWIWIRIHFFFFFFFFYILCSPSYCDSYHCSSMSAACRWDFVLWAGPRGKLKAKMPSHCPDLGSFPFPCPQINKRVCLRVCCCRHLLYSFRILAALSLSQIRGKKIKVNLPPFCSFFKFCYPSLVCLLVSAFQKLQIILS